MIFLFYFFIDNTFKNLQNCIQFFNFFCIKFYKNYALTMTFWISTKLFQRKKQRVTINTNSILKKSVNRKLSFIKVSKALKFNFRDYFEILLVFKFTTKCSFSLWIQNHVLWKPTIYFNINQVFEFNSYISTFLFRFLKIYKISKKKLFFSLFLNFFKLRKRHRPFFRRRWKKILHLKKINLFSLTKLYKFFSSFSKKKLIFNFFFYFIWSWFSRYLQILKKNKKLKKKYRFFSFPVDKQVKTMLMLKNWIKLTDEVANFQFLKNMFLNSYLPSLYNSMFKYKFYLLHKKIVYFNFIKYFTFFIGNFLEKRVNKPFYILFKFFKNKKTNFILRSQYYKLLKYQFRVGRGFFLNEMLYVIWLALKRKDLVFLVLWIKRTMERIQWKKQKMFLLSLRFIFKRYVSPYFSYLRCYGYKCVIWGKIGVSGNAKTRNFVFKNKYYSLTTKNYKLDYNFNIINTHTGVLGLSFYLIF